MRNTTLQQKIDIKQKVRIFVVLIFSTLLISCSTISTENLNPSTIYDRATLNSEFKKITKWKIGGVIGIIYNDKAESANYIYSQDGNKFDIKIYGPLGVGSIEISGNNFEVTLTNSKGQSKTANNVKSLMLDELGWYVPIQGLKYWIKATVEPNLPVEIKTDSNNLFSRLSQQGWQISYSNYQVINHKYPLPAKMRMSQNGLIIKIAIKSWQI